MGGSFILSEEEKMIRQMTRQIAKDKLAPRSAEIDQTGEFPWDIFEVYKENQLLAMPVPVEYGGGGATLTACSIAVEEFATECVNSSHLLASHWLASEGVLLGCLTEEQKKRFYPLIGEHLLAWSLTEPNHGSDVATLDTTAVEDGDYYVINGMKCFCTDAHVADYIVVLAQTDPNARPAHGISAFMVDKKNNPGIHIGKLEDMMGMRGTRACEVILEDCKVHKDDMLYEKNEGFILGMKVFDRTRCVDAAVSVGIAQGAFNAAKDYSKQRVQFGKPISELQAIRFKLADMAINIEAARNLVYRACSLIDEGELDPMVSSMANCFATDMAMQVTTDAIQTIGGPGYMRDFPVERLFRAAKLMQIVEGTNEIQRVVISNNLMKRQ